MPAQWTGKLYLHSSMERLKDNEEECDVLDAEFTFQYGEIKRSYWADCERCNYDLHSSMERLKGRYHK